MRIKIVGVPYVATLLALSTNIEDESTVLVHLDKGPTGEYVTWKGKFVDPSAVDSEFNAYWGHYFQGRLAATIDFEERAGYREVGEPVRAGHCYVADLDPAKDSLGVDLDEERRWEEHTERTNR